MDKYSDPTATPAGLFTDGNPLLGIARTVLRSIWPNSVQSELLNVIEGGGLTPNAEQLDQVLTAIRAIANRTFVGQIFSGPFAVVPTGCLVFENGYFIKTEYPQLTEYVEAYYAPILVSDIDALQYKGRFRLLSAEGDRIYLPDMRGQFVRGWANGSGALDPDGADRALGEYKPDQLKSHGHAIYKRTWKAGAADNNRDIVQNQSGSDGEFSSSNTGGAETVAKSIAWRWLIQAR